MGESIKKAIERNMKILVRIQGEAGEKRLKKKVDDSGNTITIRPQGHKDGAWIFSFTRKSLHLTGFFIFKRWTIDVLTDAPSAIDYDFGEKRILMPTWDKKTATDFINKRMIKMLLSELTEKTSMWLIMAGGLSLFTFLLLMFLAYRLGVI